jgi:hypothetical protein
LDSGDISNLAGNIARIGDSTSGAITLTNNISAYNVNALSLQTGSGISKVGSSGIFGNDLAVRSVGNVDLSGDNDINTLAFMLTGNGSDFKFNDINSFSLGTVDSLTSSTVVNGDINLSFGGDFTLTQNLNAGTGDIFLKANGSGTDIISSVYTLTGTTLTVNTTDGNFTQDGLQSGLSVSTAVSNYSYNTDSGTLKGTNNGSVDLISSNIGGGNVFVFNSSGDIGVNGTITGNGGILNLETLGIGDRSIDFGSSTINLGANSTLNITTLNNGSISGTGSLEGETLNIISSGNITQNGLSSGGSINIDFDNLNISSGGVGTTIKLTDQNDLNLNSLNLGSSTTIISAGGTDGDLKINGPFSGTSNLTLSSTGTGDIFGNGVIVASTLTINTSSGNASNDGTSTGAALNTNIDTLLSNTSTGTIKIQDTDSIDLSTSSLGTGNLNVTSGNSTGAGISIIGPLNGGSSISLNVLDSTGTITQSASIQTDSLNLTTSGGNVTLTNANNNITSLSAITNGGDLSYTEKTNNSFSTNTINLGAGNLSLNLSGNFGTISQIGASEITANKLSIDINSDTASNFIDFTNANNLNTLTITADSTSFSLNNSQGLIIEQANLDSNNTGVIGNLSLTLSSGNLTQTGVIIANGLNINTLNGSTILSNVSNDIESLSGTLSGGSFLYLDTDGLSIGNLTNVNSSISITSDASGGSGQVTNSGINLIGDVNALGLSSNLSLITQTGNMALSDYSLTAGNTLTLNSAGNISGSSFVNFPKLNAVTIMASSAGLLGEGFAPIGIVVAGLSGSSSLNDGGRGVILNYGDITTLQKDSSNQYYLYPIYAPPPPPPPPPVPPTPDNIVISDIEIDADAAQSSVYNTEDNISVRGRSESKGSSTTIVIIDETKSLNSSTNFTPNGNMVVIKRGLAN